MSRDVASGRGIPGSPKLGNSCVHISAGVTNAVSWPVLHFQTLEIRKNIGRQMAVCEYQLHGTALLAIGSILDPFHIQNSQSVGRHQS